MPTPATSGPERNSIQIAVDRGYQALVRAQQLRSEIFNLGKPSFENVRAAHRLGIELLKNLAEFQRSCVGTATSSRQVTSTLRASDRMDLIPRAVVDHVSTALALHYVGKMRGPRTSEARRTEAQFRGELADFQALMNELAEAGISIAELFDRVLFDVEVRMLLCWKDWLELHVLLRKKAQGYRRRYVAMRNGALRLLPPDAESNVLGEIEAICKLLDQVIKPDLVSELERQYRRADIPRRNSIVWNPVLRFMEEELSRSFPPLRHWEAPGGFTGSTATAAKVYSLMTAILHFAYPSIWSRDPGTTASIKSRCKRLHSER
jgi:hypothetical protein